MILTPPYKDLHNGSGKATCFVLGILSRIDPKLMAPQALCLSYERVGYSGQVLSLYILNLFMLDAWFDFFLIFILMVSLESAGILLEEHYHICFLHL